MKVNKKAIFGMFVAMIMALGVMQHFSQKNRQITEVNLQQVSLGCGYMAGSTEGGASGAWTAAAAMTGAAAVTIGYGALTNGWNPAGWVGGAVAGVCGL